MDRSPFADIPLAGSFGKRKQIRETHGTRTHRTGIDRESPCLPPEWPRELTAFGARKDGRRRTQGLLAKYMDYDLKKSC